VTVSGRAPTPEQRVAIETEARTVLVEAGAGTGKTGVMVDRYCRLVCDEELPPDSILALTFTDRAAAELRERIRAEIVTWAEAGSERARDLLPVLGSAWVTTIHGFCNRLLAGHPVAVGIDPRFRVLDAPEAERAAAEAFGRALEDFLRGGDAARERTLAAFDVAGLRGMVIGAHAELRSRGDAEPSLPDPPEPDVTAALCRARREVSAALAESKPSNSARELLERAMVVLGDGDGPAPGLEELCALCTKGGGSALAAYREAITAAACRTAEAGEGGLAYRHLQELLGLFSKRYLAAKERRAGVDFEDLQLLSAELLERGETGAQYRERFAHILVDEFQDTNRLQMRLIEALRGPRTQLMMVGDELQSIYAFRHADLDVFRGRRSEIAAGGDGELLALSGNFRSSPELIGAVNAIGTELLEDDFRPLRVGALPEPRLSEDGSVVELLLTGRDGWDEQGVELEPATDARSPANVLAEARFVAERLGALAESGVERSEMVVLLRAFTHLDAYEDSLERAGLRPYVVGGRGYWSQQQVADVCALLAVIANPLDDQALLGALASPACGAAPDTLWLLRAAVGPGRHLWPALEHLIGTSEEPPAAAERLDAIPETERALLRRLGETVERLRGRARLLPLADLVDAVVTETGYDLAVLMRPAGEARFANVRKLMRVAAEFEAVEGRDIRGLLDFLAARADADADPQAATAVEGHDGVRIMTVHSAKGLEFGVVAVPQLGRRLFAAGSREPALILGRESSSPRVGMQLRRLGASALRLFSQPELFEEQKQREVGEELRLFHVAMTRARRRLILSGVIAPQEPRHSLGTSVVERLVAAFDIDRERDSSVSFPPAEPRAGLEAEFAESHLPVRVSLASPQRAEELRVGRAEPARAAEPGNGPAPLLGHLPSPPPGRALSYTALAELGQEAFGSQEIGSGGTGTAGSRIDRASAAATGVAVHALLEWSAVNDWRDPPPELVRRIALAAEGEHRSGTGADRPEVGALTVPLRAWRSSQLFAERVRDAESIRPEVPLLLQIEGRMVRGSIDLLVEHPGRPPLIVDYKTDRLDGSRPAALAERYATQRAIYALAVAGARGIDELDVAYVFLERPDQPVLERLCAEDIERGRADLIEKVTLLEAA
jgi:ATP-dependent exoDNAse (exonuclease V) beta subunit